MKINSVINKLKALARENSKNKPEGEPGSKKRKRREKQKYDKSEKVLRIWKRS